MLDQLCPFCPGHADLGHSNHPVGRDQESPVIVFLYFSFYICDRGHAEGTPPIKKIDFFRALPEKGGGGGGPCPNFFTLFSTMLSLIF